MGAARRSLVAFVVAALVPVTAQAQPPPDPEFCQNAANAIADQRNAAGNLQAMLTQAQKQIAELQKQLAP